VLSSEEPISAQFYVLAFGRISTRDTYIIAPAENQCDKVKNVLLDLQVLGTSKLPTPVDRPAKSV
jgi:hypothetical protein